MNILHLKIEELSNINKDLDKKIEIMELRTYKLIISNNKINTYNNKKSDIEKVKQYEEIDLMSNQIVLLNDKVSSLSIENKNVIGDLDELKKINLKESLENGLLKEEKIKVKRINEDYSKQNNQLL